MHRNIYLCVYQVCPKYAGYLSLLIIILCDIEHLNRISVKNTYDNGFRAENNYINVVVIFVSITLRYIELIIPGRR